MLQVGQQREYSSSAYYKNTYTCILNVTNLINDI